MNGKKHVSRIVDVFKFAISVLETVSVKVETSLASQIAKVKGMCLREVGLWLS